MSLNATFKREISKDKDGKSREILKIVGGGLVYIFEDLIWMSLYETDFNSAYAFFLDNYEENKIAKEKMDKKVAEEVHKSDIIIFGKFTANCIKDKKVKIGMNELAISIILGKPNKINTTETATKVYKQYVYDNQYVGLADFLKK